MDWLISALPTITPLGGLLALGVWIVRQIVVGQLIPAATHERILASKEETIRVLAEAGARRDAQTDKLLTTSETTLHLLRSIAPAEGDS